MSYKYIICILISLFILFPFPACAWTSPNVPDQAITDLTELSIEDLMDVTVYSASKFIQYSKEAPSSVTVINSSDIKHYGYRTLAEILNSVRGLFTTYDRNYSYLGVRGVARPGDYNTRVLLLVNGIKLNGNIYEQALIGNEFILDVDLIDRIEIIRGPSSSLYGTNAFFGVVNVITKTGGDLKGLEVSGEAGSFGSYKKRATYGNVFKNGTEALISGSYYESKGDPALYFGEFDNPASNNGVARDLDYDRSRSLFGQVSVNDFTLQGAYDRRKKGVPTASFDTIFNNNGFFTFDESYFLDMKYEHTLSDTLAIMARINYNSSYYYGDYPNNYGLPGGPVNAVINKDYGRGEWLSGELQFSEKLFDKHRVILGSYFQKNIRQDQRNYDLSVYLDDRRDSQNWAVYIQDEYELLKNLIINAGLRYDHYETFGQTSNPRLGLIYGPFEKTSLKFLYGKAFRAPNAYELYYNDMNGPSTTKANPDLKPERITTYEAIWEQYAGNNIKTTVVGYYYRISDLISQQTDADGLLVYNNVDKVEAKGVEFEIEGKLPGGISSRASYTLQKATDPKTGKSPVNSPARLGKLNLVLPVLRDKVSLGLEEQYISARRTLGGNYADSFFITNLNLYSRKVIKGLEVSAGVFNLFNKKYGDPASEEFRQDIIMQDGRSFRLKATYLF